MLSGLEQRINELLFLVENTREFFFLLGGVCSRLGEINYFGVASYLQLATDWRGNESGPKVI